MPVSRRNPLEAFMEELMKTGVGGIGMSQFNNLEVERSKESAKIILPDGMSYEHAIEWLKRQIVQEQTRIKIHEVVQAYPLDGAHAFMAALKEKYGWTDMVPTPGFFGDQAPSYIGVETSVGTTVQVAWGSVMIPGIEGMLQVVPWVMEGRVLCAITAEVKQKYRAEVHEIIRLTRKYLLEHSIYKGKAIRVDFPDLEDETFNPVLHSPKFIKANLNPEDLILTEATMRSVHTNLWTPIIYTQAVRNAGIPLKRGVLLEGPYGVGKTLCASVTAKLCERHGWTFVYIENVERLSEAMKFAKLYAPALVFTEDIDRMDEHGASYRNDKMNTLLNTIDGVEFKNTEIMVVLSTNFVERISKAMLRPGRLDAIISMQPPDAVTVPRVIRHYANSLLDRDEDLTTVGELLAGQIPASIRESVERSKLAAIWRTSGRASYITAEDLKVAAEDMLDHLALLKETPPDTRSKREKSADSIAGALRYLADHSLKKEE